MYQYALLIRYFLCLLLVAWSPAGLQADELPAPSVGEESTIRIPYTDADSLEALDRLGALFGVYDVPAGGDVTAQQLQAIVDEMGEGVALEKTADGTTIVVRKYTVQKHTRKWRASFRGWLRRTFPDAAGKVDARFGLRLWEIEPDKETTTRRLKEDETWDKPVVLLVHGLDEPGMLWSTTAPALLDAGYVPLEFMYPNDGPISESAKRLAEALQSLRKRGVTSVAIVAHSMGGLVSRDCLTHPDLVNRQLEPNPAYPHVTHLITVGTPNHGSQMARFRFVTEVRDQAIQIWNGSNPFMSALLDGGSEALGDLLPESPYLKELNSRKLPVGVAITVIAGRASPLSVADLRENKRRLVKYLPEGWIKDQPAAIWSHLIDGVGDGAVTLSATRLAGVSDHVTVDGDHVNMLRDYLRRKSFNPPAIPVIIDRLGKKKESP